MIRRTLATIFVLWALGFLWFAVFLPGPADDRPTDAIVVPTGGQGRIARGVALLELEKAQQMLVTGVDTNVKPHEFAIQYNVGDHLMECCVTLGFAALDTRGNATETAEWISSRDIGTLRLVTTDWHMRRAALELSAALPDDVEVFWDAVPSRPSLRILFLEYHKLIASFIRSVLQR